MWCISITHLCSAPSPSNWSQSNPIASHCTLRMNYGLFVKITPSGKTMRRYVNVQAVSPVRFDIADLHSGGGLPDCWRKLRCTSINSLLHRNLLRKHCVNVDLNPRLNTFLTLLILGSLQDRATTNRQVPTKRVCHTCFMLGDLSRSKV